LGDAQIPGRGMMTDLEYCHFRQTEAGDYLRAAVGSDSSGAMRGAEDWLFEELIILSMEVAR
jgi:hypothetical protein